jgi:hypothetical protein
VPALGKCSGTICNHRVEYCDLTEDFSVLWNGDVCHGMTPLLSVSHNSAIRCSMSEVVEKIKGTIML